MAISSLFSPLDKYLVFNIFFSLIRRFCGLRLFCFSDTPLSLKKEDFEMVRVVENSPKQVIHLSVD